MSHRGFSSETILSPDAGSVLTEHVVFGRPILPGAAALELVVAASGEALPLRLRDVVLLQPLPLDAPLRVRVSFEPSEDGHRFELRSTPAAEPAPPIDRWQLCAVGRIGPASRASAANTALAEVRARCTHARAPAEHYERLAGYRLEYGPYYRTVRGARTGDEELVAELATSGTSDASFTLHPALLDGALQCVGLLPGDGRTELPFSFGEVTVYAPLPEQVMCHLRRTSVAGRRHVDVALTDDAGAAIVTLERVALRAFAPKVAQLRASPAARVGDDLFHVPREVLIPDAPTRARARGTYLVLADDDALVAAIAGRLDDGVRLVRGVADGVADLVAKAPPDLAGVLHLLSASNADRPLEEELARGPYALAAVLRALALRPGAEPVDVRVLTVGARPPVLHPARAALGGIARVANLESRAHRCHVLDVRPGTTADHAAALVDAWRRHPEGEANSRGGQLFEERLSPATPSPAGPLPLRPGGVYLISGGCTGIGLTTARMLAKRCGAKLVLMSRRGVAPAEDLAAIRAAGGEAIAVAADVRDLAAVGRALDVTLDRFGALHGVIHSAAALRDGLLRRSTTADLEQVFGPKVHGAWALHAACAARGLVLEVFLAYSSASTTFGNVGQAGYVAANRALEAFVQWRGATTGQRTASIAWTLWSQRGMATWAAPELERLGVRTLDDAHGEAALERAIELGATRLVVANVPAALAEAFVAPAEALVSAPVVAAPVAVATPPAAAAPVASAARSASAGDRQARVRAVVRDTVAAVLESPADRVDCDAGFVDLGVDSMLATTILVRVQRRLGVELKTTDIFEYASVNALARHIAASTPESDVALAPSAAVTSPAAAAPNANATTIATQVAPAPAAEPASTTDGSAPERAVAIIGMSCRFPGAPNLEALWRLLARGGDAVTEVPRSRWDIERYFDPDPEAPFKTYGRWGGFVDDLDAFDAHLFGISAREARAMDPQQRFMLELAWETLEHAGRFDLRGSRTGVFIGVSNAHYGDELTPHPFADAFTSLGNTKPLIANRISSFFDLRGPSMVVDSLCSSSIVALDQARRAILSGQCDRALVGGVSLCLAPWYYVSLSRFRALSPSGRCQAFGAGADGFVPGEGAAFVLLERADLAERGRSTVHALVRGSAVNHVGRSSGLTVPTPGAQAEVIRAALEEAGLGAHAISYVEAHGTGTALGDPIEIEGLLRALSGAEACGIGSVKSNLGHLEAAAGMASLLKVILAMAHEMLPATLHAEPPNPRIDLRGTPLSIVTTPRAWPRRAARRIAGVSAFGLGGTNAHVIVEEPPPSRPAAVDAPSLVVLSAATAHALDRLRTAVARAPGALVDIALTLGVGRARLRHRLAVVARDIDELRATLAQAELSVAREGQVAVTLRGAGHWLRPLARDLEQLGLRTVLEEATPERPQAVLEVDGVPAVTRALTAEDPRRALLEVAADAFRLGADLDLAPLWAPDAGHRIPLPTYPFDKPRFWVEPAPAATESTAGASARSGDAPATHDVPRAPAEVPAPLDQTPAIERDADLASPANDADTRAHVEALVLELVGDALGEAPETIDRRRSLREKGVDSIVAVGIVRSLERRLELDLSPTLLFDHPSVDAVVEVIARDPRASRAPGAPGSARASTAPARTTLETDPAPQRVPPAPERDAAAPARLTPPAETVPSVQMQVQVQPPTPTDAVAIIGMAGRFPGAASVAELWALLRAGRTAVRDVPKERFDIDAIYDARVGLPDHSYARWGGFIDGLELFDPRPFSITPREAEVMDPQQRWLLQVGWEALDDAGYGGSAAQRGRVGVFVGASYSDYHRGLGPSVVSDPLANLGNHNAILANRLSFALDLSGPSQTIDTLCSSSLIAVHHAARAVLDGDAEMALAAGVFLNPTPKYYLSVSSLRAASPQGRCKTFAADADGYVPAEAVAAIVLKPLARAIADGDAIHAIIRGSAIGHTGRSSGMTAPSATAQADVIARALERAGLTGDDIGYVEAHGTGTRLGDPIEVDGLTRAFARTTARRGFCALGSVKTNLGHAEPAAGIVGLIKAILTVQRAEIPPSLHAETLNPLIPFERTPFFVNRTLRAWGAASRRAGVSSFGLGGANAHVIVESWASPVPAPAPARPAEVLVVSATSERSLRAGAQAARDALDAHDLPNLAHTLAVGRAHLDLRLAIVASDTSEARRALDAWLSGHAGTGVHAGQVPDAGPARIELAADADADAVARAYASGATIDWARRDAGLGRRRVHAPPYAFDPEPYWKGDSSATMPPHVRGTHGAHDARPPQATRPRVFDPAADPLLSEHRYRGRPLVPLAALLEAALVNLEGETLSDVRVLRPLEPGVAATVRVVRDGPRLRVEDAHGPVLEGRITARTAAPPPSDVARVAARCSTAVGAPALYEALARVGLSYGPRLALVRQVHTSVEEAFATLEVHANTPALATLDAGLHALAAWEHVEATPAPALPVGIARLMLFEPLSSTRSVHISRHGGGRHDVRWLDARGHCVALAEDLTVVGAGAARARSADSAAADGLDLLHVDRWIPAPTAPVAGPQLSGRWLVITDEIGAATELATLTRGEPVELVEVPTVLDIDAAEALFATPTAGILHLACYGRSPRATALAGVARGFDPLLTLVRAAARRGLRGLTLRALTAGAHRVRPGDGPVDASATALWGLLRALRAELPELGVHALDAAVGGDVAGAARDFLAAWRTQTAGEHAARGDEFFTRDFGTISPDSSPSAGLPERAVAIVTGGLGGLGGAIAGRLAQRGATLALVQRTALPPRAIWSTWLATHGPDDATSRHIRHIERLEGMGAVVRCFAADAGDPTAIARVVDEVRAWRRRVDVVVHAAGFSIDASIVRKSHADAHTVLRPKVEGVVALDASTSEDEPLMILCGSLAGALGNAGQADYAAANAFLRGYASFRRHTLGRRTVCLEWSAWRDTGMAARLAPGTFERAGIVPLSTDEALAALEQALRADVDAAVVGRFVAPFPVPSLVRAASPASAPLRAAASPANATAAAHPSNDRGPRGAAPTARVRAAVARALGLAPEALPVTREFRALGIDSIMALEVARSLGDAMGVEVDPVEIYRHPTIAQLADRLAELAPRTVAAPTPARETTPHAATPSPPTAQAPSTAAPTLLLRTAPEPIAIVSMACRFPGAPDPDALWRVLREGRSTITEVPTSRWDIARYFDPEPGRPGKVYCKWGSFIEDLDQFDPLFFQLTPAEARLMDPQQRVLLELAYEALERGGLGGEARGSRTGVFVGASYDNYGKSLPAHLTSDPSFNLGNSLPLLANRLSFTLDLQGPSVFVNTMCSSSLVAIDTAVRSLRAGLCDAALAGGVHLCLTPAYYQSLCSLRAVSPRGMSAPFGSHADGFVPGEGAGLVLLKRLEVALRDGDTILATVRGSAVNHGGRTNGISAPSPDRQSAVIRGALAEAGIDAGSLSYVEAHGTGTLLGDPIEVRGLAEVLSGGRGHGRCGLGSIKSNLGHTEPAAGVAGLMKVVLALRHGELPPTLNADRPNPLLRLEQTPLRLITALEPWLRNGEPRRAGISSFGLGGTNAHVIIEEGSPRAS